MYLEPSEGRVNRQLALLGLPHEKLHLFAVLCLRHPFALAAFHNERNLADILILNASVRVHPLVGETAEAALLRRGETNVWRFATGDRRFSR